MSIDNYEPFASSLDNLAKQLLPPHIYSKRGVKGLELIDSRIITFICNLRRNLNRSIVVNGGGRTQSGLRSVEFYGSLEAMDKSFSQHKYGRSLDFVVSGMEAWEVRRHILENKHLYPEITFLEVSPVKKVVEGEDINAPMTWTHVDVRTQLYGGSITCWSPVLGVVTEDKVLSEKL